MTDARAAEQFLENESDVLKSWRQIFDELRMPDPTYKILKADLEHALREAERRGRREMRTECAELVDCLEIKDPSRFSSREKLRLFDVLAQVSKNIRALPLERQAGAGRTVTYD